MCWHELKHFCCCFSVRQGVWITTFLHSVLLILVLVESIHQPEYNEFDYIAKLVDILRFDPDETHTIVITSIMGSG